MGIFSALIRPIASIASEVIKGKQRKTELKEARHMKEVEAIQSAESSEFLADMKRTEDLSSSWKDEFVLIIISIPLVLCFSGPEGAKVVSEGFVALSETPDYFQYLMVSIYSVSAGVPLAGKTVKTIKSILTKTN